MRRLPLVENGLCAPSKGGMALSQICRFLGGALASQRFVSVREAAEPGNDLMMLPRVAIIAMSPLDQKILIAQRLAVHQRHVEKLQLRPAQATVESLLNALSGPTHGLRVRGKCAG